LRRPSPALVISILALFVALGGTSYAITQLPKNSVGTPQLKKNAVTGAKVKDGSLTGADVDASTLGTVPAASSANRANSADSAERATTAGSAATAGSATTADSAVTAGSATTAANALTLGGKTAAELTAASKLQCPAGMKLAAGACIEEETAGTATLYYSFLACGEDNRRLPTKGELVAYVSQYVPVGSSLTAWIEPENVTGEETGVYVTGSVFPEEIEFSTYTSLPAAARAYRCAVAASN
jgi:cytoskeletal protein RodZ